MTNVKDTHMAGPASQMWIIHDIDSIDNMEQLDKEKCYGIILYSLDDSAVDHSLILLRSPQNETDNANVLVITPINMKSFILIIGLLLGTVPLVKTNGCWVCWKSVSNLSMKLHAYKTNLTECLKMKEECTTSTTTTSTTRRAPTTTTGSTSRSSTRSADMSETIKDLQRQRNQSEMAIADLRHQSEEDHKNFSARTFQFNEDLEQRQNQSDMEMAALRQQVEEDRRNFSAQTAKIIEDLQQQLSRSEEETVKLQQQSEQDHKDFSKQTNESKKGLEKQRERSDAKMMALQERSKEELGTLSNQHDAQLEQLKEQSERYLRDLRRRGDQINATYVDMVENIKQRLEHSQSQSKEQRAEIDHLRSQLNDSLTRNKKLHALSISKINVTIGQVDQLRSDMETVLEKQRNTSAILQLKDEEIVWLQSQLPSEVEDLDLTIFTAETDDTDTTVFTTEANDIDLHMFSAEVNETDLDISNGTDLLISSNVPATDSTALSDHTNNTAHHILTTIAKTKERRLCEKLLKTCQVSSSVCNSHLTRWRSQQQQLEDIQENLTQLRSAFDSSVVIHQENLTQLRAAVDLSLVVHQEKEIHQANQIAPLRNCTEVGREPNLALKVFNKIDIIHLGLMVMFAVSIILNLTQLIIYCRPTRTLSTDP